MKARIIPLESDEHRVAQELLPWFVNGTLEGPEATSVVAHLARCSRCQDDVAQQTELRAVGAEAAAGSNVDRDWASMRSRLEAESASPPRARVREVSRGWTHWLSMTVALQAAILVVLTVALISVPTRDAAYRALGAATTVIEPNAVAVFRSDATNQQMRDALRAAGAHIVGGPTVTDAYLLRLADAAPPALASLRAQPGVLKVESLLADAPR